MTVTGELASAASEQAYHCRATVLKRGKMVSSSRKRESRKTENRELHRNAMVLALILRNHGLAVMPRRRLLSERAAFARKNGGLSGQSKGVARKTISFAGYRLSGRKKEWRSRHHWAR